MFSSQEVPQTIRQKLGEIVDFQEQIETMQEELETTEKGIKTLFEDQERLRENLKALRDNSEDQQLRVRYLDQLKKQEDRIDVARSGMENTNKEIASVRAKLGGLISNLSYGN
jgi:chromosome segregation ATPase